MILTAGFSLALQFLSFVFSLLRIKYFSDSFSIEEFGIVSIYFSVLSFISIVCILNTDRYMLKFATNNKKIEAKKTLTYLLFLPFILGPFSYFYFVLDDKFKQCELISVLSVIIIGAIHIIRCYLHGLRKIKIYLLITFLMVNIWILMLFGMIFFEKKLTFFDVASCIFISNLLLLIFSLILIFTQRDKTLNSGEAYLTYKKSVIYSSHFLPIIMSTRALELGDKFIVYSILSAKDMSYLIMANSIISCILVVLSAFSDLFKPYSFHTKDHKVSQNIEKNFFFIGFSIVTIFYLFFDAFKKFIFSKIISLDYLPSSEIASALIPSCLINLLILIFVINLERKGDVKLIAKAYIISSITFLIASYVLVSNYGIHGAISSGYLSNLLLLFILANKKFTRIFRIVKDDFYTYIVAIIFILLLDFLQLDPIKFFLICVYFFIFTLATFKRIEKFKH